MRVRAAFAAVFAAATVLLTVVPAHAATSLSAEIVSWQVVGLDSNQPATSAPELFLVQAQVTNTGAETATSAQAALSLGAPSPTDCSGGPCITLASSATYSIGDIAPGAKADAFWTVRVAKTAAAFGTETPVTVTASAANAGSVTATQAARTGLCSPDTAGGILRVEQLVSQNRNHVISYAVSPGVQRSDGSWEVVLGSNFTVTVMAHTASDYDEISVPAVVDPAGTIVPSTVSLAYQNGLTDDDIYNLGAGGDVTAQYGYRAASIGDVSLAMLIYDCSGSSYHYNSDFGVSPLIIHVVSAPPSPSPAPTAAPPASPAAPVSVAPKPTTPVTGTHSGLLAVLGWAAIGAGLVLSSRHIEKLARPHL
jgi:hypothetical protein